MTLNMIQSTRAGTHDGDEVHHLDLRAWLDELTLLIRHHPLTLRLIRGIWGARSHALSSVLIQTTSAIVGVGQIEQHDDHVSGE